MRYPHKDDSFEELVEIYEDEETLGEYFQFLKVNEFGFWTTHPEWFPELERTWEHPSVITNAIIDTGESLQHNYGQIIGELDQLGCQDIQLRFFNQSVTAELLTVALEATNNSGINSVELILPFSTDLDQYWWKDFCIKFERVSRITQYRAPENQSFKLYGREPKELFAQLYHTSQVIDSHAHCGAVDPAFFVAGMSPFMEGQHYNNCLNRKVGIDVDGEIKNCPSLTTSYGNIREVSITEALAKEHFKDLWAINKDQIAVCKDCEFRYICMDCRAFVTDPDDRYSKPSKCQYDPYQGQMIVA